MCSYAYLLAGTIMQVRAWFVHGSCMVRAASCILRASFVQVRAGSCKFGAQIFQLQFASKVNETNFFYHFNHQSCLVYKNHLE